MRYRLLPFLLFQTRPKRNGVKTGHASCPPKFLDCAIFREIFDCTERGTRLSTPRSVLASCSLNKRLRFQSEYGPSSEAWTDPDSAVAAVASPTAVVALCSFSAIARSVSCASGPPSAFLLHLPFFPSTAHLPPPRPPQL